LSSFAPLLQIEGENKTKQRILVVVVMVLLVFAGLMMAARPAAADTFSDVQSSYWAYDAINSLSGQGYITGYPYGNFAPDALITRAEFVSIMDKVLKLPAYDPAKPGFSDISGGDWYYNSVETAVHDGIAKGYGNGIFRPGYPITREEMACILVQALGIPSQVAANMGTKTNFTDDARISDWARGYVVVAVQNLGLLKGYPDSSFKPQSDATRAEACTMIENFLKVYVQG
jgi:hypothetical protein